MFLVLMDEVKFPRSVTDISEGKEVSFFWGGGGFSL